MPQTARGINPVDHQMRGWTTASLDHKVVCCRPGKPAQIGSAALSDWLLRVEAVNFTATMDDTTDLSTQRGASCPVLVRPLINPSFGIGARDWPAPSRAGG